jgi:hypothetical protein
MEPSTPAHGNKIKHMAKAYSNMQTEMSTRENGPMIKQMALAHIPKNQVLNILANGKMIYSKGKGWKNGKLTLLYKIGQMDQNTKEISTKALNKGKENTTGRMALCNIIIIIIL